MAEGSSADMNMLSRVMDRARSKLIELMRTADAWYSSRCSLRSRQSDRDRFSAPKPTWRISGEAGELNGDRQCLQYLPAARWIW